MRRRKMKIYELRKKIGKNQEEVAKDINITRATFANYEKQITEPDIKTLIAIANYFHVSVDYLIGNEQPNKLDMTSLSDTKRKCIEDIQKMSDAEVEAISHYIDGMLGREFYKKETI